MKYIKLKLLKTDPSQPRQEFDTDRLESLKKSIQIHGILVPLIVEKMPNRETFLIIDGERRYTAASLLALESVPIEIRPAMSPQERMILRFHLQEQYQSWTSFDKARAIYFFMESEGLSVRKVSEILGMSPSTVAKWVGILDLSKRTQEKAIHKRIAFSYLDGIAKVAPKFVELSKLSLEEVETLLIDKVETKAIYKWTEMTRLRKFMNIDGNEKVKLEFLKNPTMTVKNLLGMTPEGRSIELDHLMYKCSALTTLFNKFSYRKLNRYLNVRQKEVLIKLVKTINRFIK